MTNSALGNSIILLARFVAGTWWLFSYLSFLSFTKLRHSVKHETFLDTFQRYFRLAPSLV